MTTATPNAIRLVLPELHAGQQRVVAEAARFNVLACGRRFGKTTLGVDRIIQPALVGFPCAWFAPTYKLLLEVWRECLKVLHPVIQRKDAQQKRIELISGGLVEFWSLDSGTVARGRKYKRVGIDEAAMAANLETQWQEEIRPTLTDYAGDGWFFSTPKGRNYFHKLFSRGQDPGQSIHRSWQLPTATNPFIPPAEIEAARLELPVETYEQEYLAQFLENGGSVFRNIRACLTKAPTSPAEHRGHDLVLGLDWGQRTDFTAISIGCATCRREVALIRFNQVGWAFQRARVESACQDWGVRSGFVETNSIGNPNLEALQDAGLPLSGFETTGQSKPALIQSLALTFERAEFKFIDEPVATTELEAYEAKRNPNTGRTSYSAPRGLHDDTVIARALMRRAALASEGAIAEHGAPLW